MQENSSISNFKLLLRILVFVSCVAAVFFQVGRVYREASERNVINYFTKARFDDFYALPQDSLDMVFIGSSHSYCTFDPENFDKALGITSHQLGTPLQHPDTSYFSLLEVLRLQKPKVVVCEVYWDMLDDHFEMKQANSFFEVLQNDALKGQYLKEVFPLNEKVKYDLFAIRYQQDYLAYEGNQISKFLEERYGVEKAAASQPEGVEEYRGKGYVYCDWVLPAEEYDETNQFKGFDGKKWQFSNVQKGYLEKMAALCKKENIELIFVTAPVANVSMDWIENYDAVHEAVSDFAKEQGVPYLDYNLINRQEGLLENVHFRDDAHLNDDGVKIVDAHFLQFLLDKGYF